MIAALPDFIIYGTNDVLNPGTAPANNFSTERADNTTDADVDDEYVTLSFSQKTNVTSVQYSHSGYYPEVTDLAGNKLSNQSLIPVE